MNEVYSNTGDATQSVNEQIISNIEENALRYVGGYICQKIQKQIIKSNHPHKLAFVLFMSDTSGFEVDMEKDTESWTNIVDRGGLFHINDEIYTLFYNMEICVRARLSIKNVFHDSTIVHSIIKEVTENEAVLHQWHLITEEQGHNTIYIDELYLNFITKFINLRMHSFTSSIIETYKSLTHTNLQKSKTLRKSIN